VAIVSPKSDARSAAITPGPPPLVTMARRFPTGRNPHDSALAAVNSCVMVCTRTTPARLTAASNTSSAPTSDAVCDIAAMEPAA